MPTARPSVSVVMPCYNHAAYVGQAIESILSQTRPADEVLVIDDGSTDGSTDIIARYAPAVRLIRQANAGGAAARNRALGEVRGEIIANLDSDDFWQPRYLERNVAALVDGNAALAYCPCIVYDQQGRDTGRRDGSAIGDDAVADLLTGNRICHSATVVRTEALRQVGGYGRQFWGGGGPGAEDYHLWLRLAARWPIAYQSEALGCYRLHARQLTADRNAMFRVMLDVKLDFLDTHRDVARRLGRRFVRRVTRDWFWNACLDEYGRGNYRTAADLIAYYLRHYPWGPRGWMQLARTRVPWRIRSMLAGSTTAASGTVVHSKGA
ncbi:MAG: glycosyltransferase [Planctomycetes bacterium]|nr:glycosyltransferase [Planctomycetota bacterium]